MPNIDNVALSSTIYFLENWISAIYKKLGKVEADFQGGDLFPFM